MARRSPGVHELLSWAGAAAGAGHTGRRRSTSIPHHPARRQMGETPAWCSATSALGPQAARGDYHHMGNRWPAIGGYTAAGRLTICSGSRPIFVQAVSGTRINTLAGVPTNMAADGIQARHSVEGDSGRRRENSSQKRRDNPASDSMPTASTLNHRWSSGFTDGVHGRSIQAGFARHGCSCRARTRSREDGNFGHLPGPYLHRDRDRPEWSTPFRWEQLGGGLRRRARGAYNRVAGGGTLVVARACQPRPPATRGRPQGSPLHRP